MAIRQVTRAGVGLAIGIIILAALVFAGLWFVRERGDQARRQEAINIANQQLQDQSNDGVALNPDSSSNSTNDSDNSGTSNSQSNGSSSTNNSTSDSATGSTVTELPKTGAESTSIVVVGVLAFAVASFVRSRKLLASQL